MCVCVCVFLGFPFWIPFQPKQQGLPFASRAHLALTLLERLWSCLCALWRVPVLGVGPKGKQSRKPQNVCLCGERKCGPYFETRIRETATRNISFMVGRLSKMAGGHKLPQFAGSRVLNLASLPLLALSPWACLCSACSTSPASFQSGLVNICWKGRLRIHIQVQLNLCPIWILVFLHLLADL